ncbi:hypothetical protein F4804DRAFT_292845 [Jackrogersella minutella]|nr:hypothetical protein F4804DRAFT_292845 [Jackrogersella minutella]
MRPIIANKASLRLLSSLRRPPANRSFSASRHVKAANQVFSPVRHPDDLHTYQMLASSACTPLLTLWTASASDTSREAEALARSVVEGGAGEAEGGVAFCAVEMDAPDVAAAGLATNYMVTKAPTLLAFDGGEPQAPTKVHDPRFLVDKAFLEFWVREEAKRHAYRADGGGFGAGWR